MRALLLWVALLALAGAAEGRRRGPDPCAPPRQTFISPAGEPFHASVGETAPVAVWFAGADADRNGGLTSAELQADAARFFAVIDRDGNGEIIPDELTRYEREVAPEISIYDPTPLPREVKRRRDRDYGAPLGAGRYALQNIPNPIAAADSDYNRGITRAELAAAVARSFGALAKNGTALTLATLPPTPQQAILAACAARAAKRRR